MTKTLSRAVSLLLLWVCGALAAQAEPARAGYGDRNTIRLDGRAFRALSTLRRGRTAGHRQVPLAAAIPVDLRRFAGQARRQDGTGRRGVAGPAELSIAPLPAPNGPFGPCSRLQSRLP